MGKHEESCLSDKNQVGSGGARKSCKVSKKSLGGNKKICPTYCRRKSVRCKSYRPVRKSRKPKSRKHR